MTALHVTQEVKQDEDLSIKFSPDLMDCNITELGKEQAGRAHKILKDIEISHVFSSPMRRCL